MIFNYFRPLAIVLTLSLSPLLSQSQLSIDTLAIQDFEVSPASPTWTFTGPVVYNSGMTSTSAAPPNSPIGIGGSRAWETTSNSGGLILHFANVSIPSGYDSIRFHFNLAAMNLNSGSGGPDDLDYVLVEVSTNGGSTFYNRLRIRGATSNNSFWAYSASGVAKLYYQPASEVVFQPTTTGLQTTFGYSNCEIVFPGSVTDVSIRIVGRSSSSTDTWLIDDVLLTAERNCTNSTNTITETTCETYMAPSGAIYNASGTYTDIIPNSSGCDSIITINLTIDTLSLNISASGDTGTAMQPGAVYQWLDCNNNYAVIPGETGQQFIAQTDGSYAVQIANGTCRDTTVCIDLVASTVGIESNSFNATGIFPNPSNGVFTFQTDGMATNATAYITDQTGRKVGQWDNLDGQKFTFDLSNEPNGIYIFEFLNDDKMYSTRIIKQ